MNILYALVLVIYSPTQSPVAKNYHPPVIDKIEMKRNMKQDDCVAMMLEIQDQISSKSNVEFQCHGVDKKGGSIVLVPN